jgi:Fe-S cluster assembly protein SufD
MLAATVADAAQEFDQRTLQDHASPDTSSDLLYKNALYDEAKTIFAGLIRVAPHAHRTDAYQKVRNLVLSAEAEAVSLPGLEILADQVRCSHGATTGEINPEELFYMQTRGISERDAYRLITFGFLNEVIERLPDESLRVSLSEALHKRLSGH